MSTTQYSPQELVDLYQLARNVQFRYALDQYEDEILKGILATIIKARGEVKAGLDRYFVSQVQDERGLALLAEFDKLTMAARETLREQILDASGEAGKYATDQHIDILSFGGRVTPFNSIALSPDQFRAFFVATPLGGKLLNEWIDSAFDSTVRAGMIEELQAGVLQGEGYPALVKRLTSDFELTKREAINITRTFVQTANVQAQESVYAANADIIPRVKWCATLENGYKSTGRGTCLVCAGLDGREFPREKHPPCPRHVNCRCVILPVTSTWKDLGIDLPELEEAVRPYTKRPDQNIDTGGRRTILEVGQHQGDYGSWFEQQSKKFKVDAVGPARYDLLKSGAVKWDDLVTDEGRVRTLKELRGIKQ